MLNETYRGMLAHKSVIRETFMYGKQRAAEIGYENVFDYSLGNPSVPCPPQFTQAMQNLLETEGVDEQQMQDNDIRLKDAYRKKEGLLMQKYFG